MVYLFFNRTLLIKFVKKSPRQLFAPIWSFFGFETNRNINQGRAHSYFDKLSFKF